MARPCSLQSRGAEHPLHRPGRHRLRAVRLLWLTDQHPQPRQVGGERAALHEHAYDGALLAVAVLHAERAEPPLQRDGMHHRGVDGLPGQQRCDPFRERVPVRDAAAARIRHILRRQMAPHTRRTDQRRWTVHPMATRAGVRPLLRLPRRRHSPVLSRPGLRQPPGRAAEDPRGGLPPLGRSRRQGDRVRRRPQTGRPRQAVLPLLRDGRQPAPHRYPRNGPTSTRASSTTAGTPTARGCSRGRRNWASCPRTRCCPGTTPTCSSGTSSPRTNDGSTPA